MFSFEFVDVHETSLSLSIYKRCFSNSDFCKFIYEVSPSDEKGETIMNTPLLKGMKYIIFANYGSEHKAIGFVHLSLSPKSTFCEIGGGIIPEHLNTGLGIFACAGCIHTILNRYPDLIIKATTYQKNIRCSKMLKSLGFTQTLRGNHFVRHTLAKSDFDNNFVKKISEKIDLSNIDNTMLEIRELI